MTADTGPTTSNPGMASDNKGYVMGELLTESPVMSRASSISLLSSTTGSGSSTTGHSSSTSIASSSHTLPVSTRDLARLLLNADSAVTSFTVDYPEDGEIVIKITRAETPGSISLKSDASTSSLPSVETSFVSLATQHTITSTVPTSLNLNRYPAPSSSSHNSSVYNARKSSSKYSLPLYRTPPELPAPGLGLKLLCLDGGGIRGLSILHILQGLLNELTQAGYSETTPPCEVFDLICGTSTGGLIALLLGPRMRMTVPEVIALYKKLSRKIFKSNFVMKFMRFITTRYRLNTTILERQIRREIRERTGDEMTGMNAGACWYDCKTFVVAVDYEAMNKGVPVLFRTYDLPGNASVKADSCPIYQAARATSAAPTWFRPQMIYGKSFIDGGVGNNNPAALALREAHQIWPGREIDAIISIGTGTSADISARNPKQACIGHTTGSHSVHSLMEQLHASEGNYFRFDVPDMGSAVDLGDWEKIGKIEKMTGDYLNTEQVRERMQRCSRTFNLSL